MKKVKYLLGFLILTLVFFVAGCPSNNDTTKYTIKFLNDDGTLLQTVKVNEGATAVYTGATPTKKSADPDIIYEFKDWSVSVKNVKSDIETVATFTSRISSTAIRTKYTNLTKLEQSVSEDSVLDKDLIAYAKVSAYVDGDTTHFRVNLTSGNKKISVRYLGIDTPESTFKIEPWGIQAANFTKTKLMSAKKIILQADSEKLKDGNDRYLCWVWYQPEDGADFRLLNLEIVEESYSNAKGYTGTRYAETFMKVVNRSQAYNDRVNGGIDPMFDYDNVGERMTIRQLLEKYGTPDAIKNEEGKGKKVYIEGTVVRKVGVSSAYIEQVDNGYIAIDPETGEEITVEGDGKTYGIYLYGGYNQVTALKEGWTIVTSANISYHYGSIQLVGVSNSTIDYSSTEVSEIVPATLTDDEWNNLESGLLYRLVKFSSLTVTGGFDAKDSDSYTIYTTTKGGAVVNVRVDQNVAIMFNGKKNTTWQLFEGKTLEVVGIISRYVPYDGAEVQYQILITQAKDINF